MISSMKLILLLAFLLAISISKHHVIVDSFSCLAHLLTQIFLSDLYSITAETEAAAPADGVVMDGLSAEQEKVIADSKESFVFQAEVNRLMDIIINSLCKSY